MRLDRLGVVGLQRRRGCGCGCGIRDAHGHDIVVADHQLQVEVVARMRAPAHALHDSPHRQRVWHGPLQHVRNDVKLDLHGLRHADQRCGQTCELHVHGPVGRRHAGNAIARRKRYAGAAVAPHHQPRASVGVERSESVRIVAVPAHRDHHSARVAVRGVHLVRRPRLHLRVVAPGQRARLRLRVDRLYSHARRLVIARDQLLKPTTLEVPERLPARRVLAPVAVHAKGSAGALGARKRPERPARPEPRKRRHHLPVPDRNACEGRVVPVQPLAHRGVVRWCL